MKNKILLSIAAIIFIFAIKTVAQPFDYSKKIPVDSSIKFGKLANGMVYYIKKNKKPENRAELRLAVNAGSVLEDTDQLGLAHFTEHMAFNGTTHFAKNELVSYLQSVGVKFGADLNAYTSFDQTIYMLTIPTDSAAVLDKGFDVLSDWAHEQTFDSTEIEKERGVVIEEWRLGRGAEQRMQDKYIPVLFHDSRYAIRLPIGTKKSLETFHRNSIVRFYKDWYRPDLMAIIAVGDFDMAKIEKEIIDKFSNIPNPKNERPRIVYNVPDHKEILASVNSDKEAAEADVSIFYLNNKEPDITYANYRDHAKELLYFTMLNQRLDELSQLPNPPFLGGYSTDGNIGARTKYAYVSMAAVTDTGIMTGLKTLLDENEKVKRFGFTQSEFNRAKKDILKMYEKYYNERDKTESSSYADEFIRNFLNGESIPGIAFEYNFMQKYLPGAKLEEINQLATKWITDSNRVVIVTAPQKESVKMPTDKEIIQLVENASKANVSAYKDKITDSELLSQKPKPGKVIKENQIKDIAVTELTLSNGVKVILKSTDFKNDEIKFSAISPGGQFLYPDKDNFSANFAANIIDESGLAKFSIIDLQKILAGKSVNVTPYISSYTEGLNGNCVPKDMETMFQLIYLYFIQPRLDSAAFTSFINKVKGYLANIESDPQMFYSDTLKRILSQNHPRGGGIPKVSDIDKIDLQRVYQIYKDRFADASDFTFTIVGNFNTDSIKPLLEEYLGSLPSNNRKESWKDVGIRPPKGEVFRNIYKGTDPKSRVNMIFTGETKYSPEEAYYLKSLADILEIRLIEVLREEKSGVYGVGAMAAMGRIPYQNYTIKIQFPCGPENVDSLVSETWQIIKEIQKNGISDKNLNKIKETQERELEVSLKTNGYWMNFLENSSFYNDNMSEILKKKEMIEKLTSKDIQNVANKYFNEKYIKVVLYPQK